MEKHPHQTNKSGRGETSCSSRGEKKPQERPSPTVPAVQNPSTSVTCAIETATHGSVSLITGGGAVPAEQTARNKDPGFILLWPGSLRLEQ